MTHNEGHHVLTRDDRISIQTAENAAQGITWIYDNWHICLLSIIIICAIGILSGKVKLK